MREGFAVAAFSDRGLALAETIAAQLGGTACRCGADLSLEDFTARTFPTCAGLIFVGAAGIAVRAVAPYLKNKAEDPAVVCVDEKGRYAVSLLSGHLGGANELARLVAEVTGGEAVITTATDVRGVFAVDLWARRQNLTVLQRERIKTVSAKALRGEGVSISCPWPVRGEAPEGVTLGESCDAVVDYRRRTDGALQLVPRTLTLGIGCKRGTEQAQLETQFLRFCGERGIEPAAVAAAATIDRKADEPGLIAFCQAHEWPLHVYTAGRLKTAPGSFTASAFVESRVGVDNVCERACVLAGGELIESKYACDGVTFALALRSPELDWRWRNG